MLFEAQIARQGTYGALQGGSAKKQFQPRNVRIQKKRVSSTRRPKNSPPDCFLNGLSNPLQKKTKKEQARKNIRTCSLARCKGFEPLTFWFVVLD